VKRPIQNALRFAPCAMPISAWDRMQFQADIKELGLCRVRQF